LNKKIKISRIFNNQDLNKFTNLTGDNNPLHTSSTCARKFNFSDRILHGALIVSYFSKIIGTKMPGKNSLILFSEYRFHKPAYPNTVVVFTAEIKSYSKATKTFEIYLTATNNKTLLVSGKVACIKYKV
jgi:3-hydroxybutyryl-CoA dehydratase